MVCFIHDNNLEPRQTTCYFMSRQQELSTYVIHYEPFIGSQVLLYHCVGLHQGREKDAFVIDTLYDYLWNCCGGCQKCPIVPCKG